MERHCYQSQRRASSTRPSPMDVLRSQRQAVLQSAGWAGGGQGQGPWAELLADPLLHPCRAFLKRGLKRGRREVNAGAHIGLAHDVECAYTLPSTQHLSSPP